MDALRNEILKKREPNYSIDGFKFCSRNEFARYMNEKYKRPITSTLKRLDKGLSEEECMLTGYEMRSKAYTKGRIRITDTVTGKVYEFNNTRDKRLLKMIGGSTISKGLKTGKPIGGYRNSLWKNPLIIQRIN